MSLKSELHTQLTNLGFTPKVQEQEFQSKPESVKTKWLE